jgi:hypothetical protein
MLKRADADMRFGREPFRKHVIFDDAGSPPIEFLRFNFKTRPIGSSTSR